MKKQILFCTYISLTLIAFLLTPLQSTAQLYNEGAIVTIVSNAKLYVKGDLVNQVNQQTFGNDPNFSGSLGIQIIVGGNVENNTGNELFFSADSSQVVLQGNQQQLILGTDSINFFGLEINNSADSIVLQRAISVLDSLQLSSGLFNLNGKDINFGQTGYLKGENSSTYIFGDSGSIYLNVNMPPMGFAQNVGGLGAFINTTANFGNTTFRRSHQTQHVADTAIARYFDIQPSFSAVQAQNFVFNYLGHELNGLSEDSIALYRSTNSGTSWSLEQASKNQAADNMALSNAQFPARYTIANDICLNNPILVDLGADTSICKNDSIVLDAGNPGLTYLWSTGATTQTINANNGLYSVTVTRGDNCQGIDTIDVTNFDFPLPIFGNDTTICQGTPLSLGDSNNINNGPFSWSTGESTRTISFNTDTVKTDTVIVAISNVSGCVRNDTIIVDIIGQPVVDLGNDTSLCQLDTLILDASYAGATYIWSTAATTPTITANASSNYSVTVTNDICEAIDTVNVIKSNLIAATNSTDVNCSGDSTGYAAADGVNGVEPYSYLWSTGDTTRDIVNLPTGTYSVTITDSIGCTVIPNPIVVNQPTPLAVSFVTTNESCNLGMDGSINITASGGNGGYTYNWGGNNFFQNQLNLVAGTYTVTVSDNRGCSTIDSATITRPSGFSYYLNFNDISCNAANDANISYSLSGGTAPFTFDWSNSSIDSVQSNLSAGTYTVLISDSNNCSNRDTVQVTNPPLILSAVNSTNINCSGDSSGSINLSASGGRGSLSFAWSNGDTTANLANLGAGKYFVTISDSISCSKVDSAKITEPTAISYNLNATNISCYGNTNGSIDLTVSGGVTPYTYTWSNSATTEDINNLIAGNYTLTIADANGCSIVDSAKISTPDSLSIAAIVSNVNCNGKATGTINLTVSGGNTPYTFQWSNSASTEDLANLTAGTYHLTLTDNNGCSKVDSFSISENNALVVSTSTTQANCNTADGSATVSVSGGSGSYTYLWVNNAANTATNINLAAGNYVVRVTDSLGCLDSATASISNISGPNLTLDSIQNIDCFGDSSGAISINVSGGASPYTYLWSNSSLTQNITQLSSNSYNVSVTDNNNCLVTANYQVSQGDSIGIGLLVSNNTCFNAMDGAISTNIIGGTGSYTYSWNNMSTAANLTALDTGKYILQVTDSLACIAKDSIQLTQPDSLITAFLVSNLNCNNDFSGSIDANVSGGTIPYSYAWNNSAFTATISNLKANTYSVSVTDANNCALIDSTVITEPDTIAIVSNVQQVLCSGDSSASIALNAMGGTTPYTYNWSNSASNDSIFNLTIGNYNITLTDANSCTEIDVFVITQPTALSLLLNASGVRCGGDSSGVISSLVSGGVMPYSYNWSNGSLQDSIKGLKAGMYQLSVSDINGCQIIDSAEVTGNSSLMANSLKTNISCSKQNDGSIAIQVSGGVTPYTFSWSDFSNAQTRTNLNAGIYNVTVSDREGCTQALSDTISEPSAIAVIANTTDVSCSGASNGIIDLTVSGGNAPYSFNWSSGQSIDSISGLAGGVYFVTITDNNGCTLSSSYTIENPNPLAINAAVSNIGCGDKSKSGSISVTARGGTKPYTYKWSNASNGAINNNLGVGNYDLTLTDAGGCVANASYSIQLEGTPVFARYLSASFATSDDTISFVNLSYPNPAAYQWDFDDSTGSNELDVLHSYQSRLVRDGDSTFYKVSLVSDNGTCIDSMSKIITIKNLGQQREKEGADFSEIEDIAFIEELDLYPIPAKNALNYKLILGKKEAVNIRIYDLSGRLLLPKRTASAKKLNGAIDISSFAKGTYIIIFETEADTQSVQFIKM